MSFFSPMTEPVITDQGRTLDPEHAGEERQREGRWTAWLVYFLRAMAVLSPAMRSAACSR